MLNPRERCERRLVGLKAMRQPREDEWRQIARLAAPSRSRFLNSETNRNQRKGPVVLNSHGIRSFRTLTGGMTSGLSSPSRPWFMLQTYDEAIMEDPEAKAWLAEVERRMYAFLASTNFYSSVKTGYSELGLFGTEACVMIEDDQQGAVCHALTAGEYWIANSKAMVADTLYRRVPMTVKQCVDSFKDRVSDRVRTAYDRGDYDLSVDVMHAIEPNDERIDGRMDAAGKAYRSIWWDEGDTNKSTLREGGYDEKPFWAPRWDTTGSDVWGNSPGMDALPDLRELQLQCKRKGEAVDWLVKPEKVAPPGLKLKNVPGAVTYAASVDKDMVLVPYQVPYQAVQAILSDIERSERAIDVAAYADLFNAITNMQGIQPRTVEEIASRNEEKLTQLGPVIERVNNEKLEVAIDRTFGIMSRGQLLPPAPEALHGVDLKINFVSILTQMQRMVGIGQIERTAGFIGNLMGAFPEAGDKLNVDEMIDDYADRAGSPPRMIRSNDEVAKIRANRAQAQQAEKTAAMMPAVQQGADAARLLSETDTGGGQNLLQQMMPQ
jgi:hypothetical protein